MKYLFLVTGVLLFALTIALFARAANSQPADAAPVNSDLLVPDLDAPPAAAPAVPDPTEDPGAYVSAVTALARAGKWLALCGTLAMGLIFVLRRFVFPGVAWFQTDRGGTVLAVGTAFCIGFFGALAGGVPLGGSASAGLALLMAAVAAYVVPKKMGQTA